VSACGGPRVRRAARPVLRSQSGRAGAADVRPGRAECDGRRCAAAPLAHSIGANVF
jgi:hypothetical protein